MGIEEKVGEAHCFHNDKLHYRSNEEHESYCAMSEDKCKFYKRVKNKEYCRAYQDGRTTDI